MSAPARPASAPSRCAVGRCAYAVRPPGRSVRSGGLQGLTAAVAAPSATTVAIFRAAHRPLARDSSTACCPYSEDLGGVGRRKGRHAEVGECEFGRAGDGRRFRRRIVTGQRERATLRVRADEVRVPQRIGGPVETRRLAVPDAGHARIAQLAGLTRELRARHGGRGEFLVQAWLRHDGVLGEQRGVPRQLNVQAAQWRALIAGHVGRRGPPGALVGPRPVEQHAHQSLDAGQVDGTFLALVAILEAEPLTGTGRHRTHTDLHICRPAGRRYARRSSSSSPDR